VAQAIVFHGLCTQLILALFMWLVAGLGNPGGKYADTPHNLGFLVADVLAARHNIRLTRPEERALIGPGEIAGKRVLLAKPQTFMNLSGVSVKPLMVKHEILPENLILVYDDLDLPWGSIRVRPKGSPGSHNGVISVTDYLGTKEFPRVRVGIHPGHPLKSSSGKPTGADYVLSPFTRQQEKELGELVDRAADAVTLIIAEGVEKAMAEFNRRAPGSTKEEE
jgi:peptidyl-tRNA hydrolase, PTH1 family